jgi:hypothetical protein
MEPQKDRLEEFFKKTFEKLDEQPPGAWDVPSGKVWENVEAVIGGQGSNRRAGYFNKNWLLALVVLLLAVIAWQWWAFRKDVETLEKEVSTHTATIHHLKNDLEKQQAAPVPKAPAQPQPAPGKTEPALQSSVPEKISFNKNTVAQNHDTPLQPRAVPSKPGNTSSNSGAGATSPPATDGHTFPGQNLAQLPTDATGSLTAGSGNLTEPVASEPGLVREPVLLPMLASGTPFLQTSSSQAVLPLPAASFGLSVPPVKTGKDMHAGVYFSPTYSYRSVHHKMKNVSTPYEKTESPKMSYVAGASVGIDLADHWRLWSGLNYQLFHQESRHTVGMRYTAVGAVTEQDGDVVNSYQANLQTSYGEAEVEVRIANDAQSNLPNLNEGRIFPVRFKAALELQHLGIPLLAEYHFGSKRLGFSLKGGLVGSLLVDKSVEIKQVQLLHDRLRLRRTDVVSDRFLRNIKSATLDLQLSAGVRIGLSERLSLAFEPTFRSNLTPVFGSEKLETRMYSLAVHAGVYYRF